MTLPLDYWVEIPAGEFLIGVSEARRDLIRDQLRRQLSYDRFSDQEREVIETIKRKIHSHRERRIVSDERTVKPVDLTREEWNFYRADLFSTIIDKELELLTTPVQEAVWVDQFYMARFPVTTYQIGALEFETELSAYHLPSPLEGRPRERSPAIVQIKDIREICRMIGGRLPTYLEWEKAARGADGRLYPWGDAWVSEAGYFYRDQPLPSFAVDAFPTGVSSYGVWGMAGGLPEVVTVPGQGFTISAYDSTELRGCHPKESSETWAWYDHMVIWSGTGRWVGFRPVLDKWPIQQWSGFSAEPEEKQPQKPDPLLTQFDLLVIKMEADAALEPALTTIEAGQKEEAKQLLGKYLKSNPQDEHAWLLLAAVVADVTKQGDCLERALKINPANKLTQKMWERWRKNTALLSDEQTSEEG